MQNFSWIATSHLKTSVHLAWNYPEFEWFFPTPGFYAFVQNLICYNKFPSKIFLKNAFISTYWPKTEFERFFTTPGGDTFPFKKFFNSGFIFFGGVIFDGGVTLTARGRKKTFLIQFLVDKLKSMHFYASFGWDLFFRKWIFNQKNLSNSVFVQ